MHKNQQFDTWSLWRLLSICILLVAGCGSDSINSFPPDQKIQTIEVVSSTPEVDSIQIEPNTTVSVQFSSELSIPSVTNSTFSLVGPQGAVDSDLTVSGATAHLSPKQDLAYVSEYTTEVSEEVEDLLGNSLGTLYRARFTTRDGVWTTPWDSGAEGGDFPSLAVNNPGEAVMGHNSTGGGLVSEFDPESQIWVTTNFGDVAVDDVAINDQGSIWITMSFFDGNMDHAMVTRKIPDGVWEVEATLFTSASNTTRLGVDQQGNALAVIEDRQGSSSTLYWSRYQEGVWTPVEQLTTGNYLHMSDFAVNQSGQAVLVWLQSADHLHYGAYFDPDTGWSTPVALATYGGCTGSVAINSLGDAVTSWCQSSPVAGYYTSFYRPSSGWEPISLAMPFPTEPYMYRLPAVDINDSGEAWLLGAFNYLSMPYDGEVVVTRYLPGADWSEQENIGTGLTELLSRPNIHVDKAGNVLAYWEKYDTVLGGLPYFNRRQNYTGEWMGPQAIHAEAIGSLGTFAGSDSGKAVAAWLQDVRVSSSIFR